MHSYPCGWCAETTDEVIAAFKGLVDQAGQTVKLSEPG